MSSEQLSGRNTTVKETWVGGRRERERDSNMENRRVGEKTCWGKCVGFVFVFFI